MLTLRNLILETTLYEDDEAKQRGWKHIAFGTYEDPSGKRYRRGEDGNWKEVGADDTSKTPTDVWGEYEARVGELEGEGLDRSDAQGIADVEFERKYGRGWEKSATKGDKPREDKSKTIADVIDTHIKKQRLDLITNPKEQRAARALVKMSELKDDRKFSTGLNSDKMWEARSEMINVANSSKHSGGEADGADLQHHLESIAKERGVDFEEIEIEFGDGELDVGNNPELAMAARKALAVVVGKHIDSLHRHGVGAIGFAGRPPTMSWFKK